MASIVCYEGISKFYQPSNIGATLQRCQKMFAHGFDLSVGVLHDALEPYANLLTRPLQAL